MPGHSRNAWDEPLHTPKLCESLSEIENDSSISIGYGGPKLWPDSQYVAHVVVFTEAAFHRVTTIFLACLREHAPRLLDDVAVHICPTTTEDIVLHIGLDRWSAEDPLKEAFRLGCLLRDSFAAAELSLRGQR